jgi:hypothetical protein
MGRSGFRGRPEWENPNDWLNRIERMEPWPHKNQMESPRGDCHCHRRAHRLVAVLPALFRQDGPGNIFQGRDLGVHIQAQVRVFPKRGLVPQGQRAGRHPPPGRRRPPFEAGELQIHQRPGPARLPRLPSRPQEKRGRDGQGVCRPRPPQGEHRKPELSDSGERGPIQVGEHRHLVQIVQRHLQRGFFEITRAM